MKSAKVFLAVILALCSMLSFFPPVAQAQVITGTATLNYVGSNIYATWINVNYPTSSQTPINFVIPTANLNSMLATVLTAQSSGKSLLIQLPTDYAEWTQLVGVISQ